MENLLTIGERLIFGIMGLAPRHQPLKPVFKGWLGIRTHGAAQA
jgi:hypothetical protein